MDKLITALAPIFAAGLGIQQLGEILSPLIDKISTDYKKIIIGLVSLTLGLLVAFQFEFHVINELLGAKPHKHGYLDAIVTGLIISGGTEGINSILKFLKYTKEDKKNEAASNTPVNASAPHAAIVPVPSQPALNAMNLK